MVLFTWKYMQQGGGHETKVQDNQVANPEAQTPPDHPETCPYAMAAIPAGAMLWPYLIYGHRATTANMSFQFQSSGQQSDV